MRFVHLASENFFYFAQPVNDDKFLSPQKIAKMKIVIGREFENLPTHTSFLKLEARPWSANKGATNQELMNK